MARRHWHAKQDRPEHWKFGHWVENLSPELPPPDPPPPGPGDPPPDPPPGPGSTPGGAVHGLLFYADTFEVEVIDKYSPKYRRRRW